MTDFRAPAEPVRTPVLPEAARLPTARAVAAFRRTGPAMDLFVA